MSITAAAVLLNWAQHVETSAEDALAITGPGDSDITRSMLEQTGEKYAKVFFNKTKDNKKRQQQKYLT